LRNSPEQDEISVQEVLELGIFVELLTQQFAGPSGVRIKVNEDQLVIALGLGHGFVQGSLEPALGRGQGGEDKHERQG
jgi:hypothetical protein